VGLATLERWRSDALAQPGRDRVWTAAARFDAMLTPRCQNRCRSDRFGKLGGVDRSMNWHDTDKNSKTEL